MDKWQAQDLYWNSFGLPAYNENTVPETAKMPYITYEAVDGSLDGEMSVNASAWFRGTKWSEVCQQTDAIARNADREIKIDGGYMKVRKAPSYFAQPMGEPSDKAVRRMRLNVNIEFLSA